MMNPMEGKGTADASLPWLWVIEYLASYERVNLQLLSGLVESAPVLHNELGENLRELICLRCLEQLYGPANINETTSDVPQDLDSGPMFELSRSCEDVLGDILQEGSVSDFRMSGREQLKSQVCQFIMRKRTTVPKPSLQQLKDAVPRGTHLDAAFLKVLSGVACPTYDNRVSFGNVWHSGDTCECAPDRRIDNDQNMESNGNLNTAEHDCSEQHLEGDSVIRASTLSKGNLTALDAENMSQNSQENLHIDDDFTVHSPSSQKLKQSILYARQPEKSNAIVIESDSKSGGDTEDRFDFAQDQMETRGEHRIVDECAEMHGEQRGLSDRLPDRNKEGSAIQKSMARGRGDPVTSQNPTDGLYTGEFQQRDIIDRDVVCLRDQQQVEELSSDSDGYLNNDFNGSMKQEFLASHFTSMVGSLESFEQMMQNICMKCNEGGQLLVCHTSRCPLVVHRNCVDSSTSSNENGNFFCYFCQYSNAISEYLEAKKEATSARKDLPEFICTIFEHHPKKLKRTHHDHSGIDIDGLAEVSEDYYYSQEGEYEEQGEPVSCANKVNNLQRQGEESAKEHEQPKLNGYTWNQISDYRLQSVGGSAGQADGSERDSDLNVSSPIEEDEEVYNGDAAAGGGAQEIEENEKNTLLSNPPSREFELDAFGRPPLDTKGKQVNGKIQQCQSGGRFEGPEAEVMSVDWGNGSNLAANTTRTLDQKSGEIGYQQEASPDDNNEPLQKPSCALHVDGEDDFEDDIEDSDADDETIISNYSINFRRRAWKNFLNPVIRVLCGRKHWSLVLLCKAWSNSSGPQEQMADLLFLPGISRRVADWSLEIDWINHGHQE